MVDSDKSANVKFRSDGLISNKVKNDYCFRGHANLR